MVMLALLLISLTLLMLTIAGIRDRLPRRVRAPEIQALAAWGAAGVLCTTAFLGMLSYGLFVLPFAGLAVISAARRFPAGRDVLGLCFGVGLTLTVIGLGNLDYRPLPSSGVVTLAPGETSVTYGGMDPRPWLIAGTVLALVTLATVLLLARRRDGAERSGERLHRHA